MNYRALLFDFDGTLAATLPSWRRAYQLALAHYGVQLADEEVVARCFYTAYTEIGRTFGIDCHATLERQVNGYVTELVPSSPLYPYLAELLEAAKSQGLLIGLVTSSWRGVVEPFLSRAGLLPLFDCLTTCDEVPRLKPDPAPIFHALQALAVEPHEALLVGDSRADILAGRAAGVDVALFFPQEHHAYYSFPQLHALNPRYTVACHRELFEVVVPSAAARAVG